MWIDTASHYNLFTLTQDHNLLQNQNTEDVVAGLGEIGNPIRQLISKATNTVGYDKNPAITDKISKHDSLQTRLLHVCIPFNENFERSVIELNKKFTPLGIVIHSTIGLGTTKKLQQKLEIPIIYSATRGVHKRMLYDLRRYTKFYAIEKDAPNAKWATSNYSDLLKKCRVKSKQMTDPITLELSKIIVDTSYYGWLINYAQLSNMIAIKHKVDYDEMWSFADEIHKYLGNRPKMFPGFIGGHCVIPNLALINDQTLDLIKEINHDYAKILKAKKYKKR